MKKVVVREDVKDKSLFPAVPLESPMLKQRLEWYIYTQYALAVTSHEENFTRSLFEMLSKALREEAKLYSSISKIVSHPYYRSIISLGKKVLPYLFEQMIHSPYWWFHALEEITGEDPILESHYGKLQEMTHDWLQWAKTNGYL